MTKVDQIKSELQSLSDSERNEIHEWLLRREWTDDDWDRQMRADAAAGKLNKLIEQAREDIRHGRTWPLP